MVEIITKNTNKTMRIQLTSELLGVATIKKKKKTKISIMFL